MPPVPLSAFLPVGRLSISRMLPCLIGCRRPGFEQFFCGWPLAGIDAVGFQAPHKRQISRTLHTLPNSEDGSSPPSA